MPKLYALLSTAKPFDGSDYDNYQRRALASWQKVAERRIMFNDPEDIESIGDEFVNPTSHPATLYEMLQYAVSHFPPESIFAIVNSDIRLTEETTIIPEVVEYHKLGRAWACTSFRWEDGQVRGYGLDFFCMTPVMAAQVLRDCPTFMTLGRGLWDSWLNGWLRCHLRSGKYFNITEWKCVHHPLHDRVPGRLSNYTEEQVKTIMSSGDLDAGGIPNTYYRPDGLHSGV